MNILIKINKVIGKIEEYILSYSVIAMATVLIGNVISRTVFNRSWSFAEEVGASLVVVVTFIGTSYAARKGMHIRMTAIFDSVPKKIQKIMMIIASGMTSLTLFYLTHLTIIYTLSVKKTGRSTPALDFPVYILTSIVALGFFMAAIQYAINVILNAKGKELYLGSEEVSADEVEPTDCVNV